ncbi:MAG TPA: CBS domain-containing protein [Jatrophihabitans sp.]|uniref:CBS domain-containing protein n=1 Tax=Jatrophihabitans sp. TaxID=1932789 RepID=UPI002E0C7D94|nr:CBS domain-containing protein [Jatrophihabitans sp.]
MKISDILRHKHTAPGTSVVTIAPSDTVTTLLATLAEHNVGALLVVDPGADGAVAGIVSERDIVRRIAQDGAHVLEQPVSVIMTSGVVSCSSSDSVDSIAETMTTRRIRHMPVIDNGILTGIVSIGDVVSSRIRQLEHDRGQLEQYISS